MHVVTLKGTGDIEEWRRAARSLVRRGVPPEAIEWRTAAADRELFAGTPALPPDGSEDANGPAVPPAFIAYAEAVVCHSDPGRFALLYRLLWRLLGDRNLLAIAADPDVCALKRLEKSVRRDSHKMKAFVRFKEIDAGGPHARRRFVAWFEPDHHIVARTSGFFQRRFNDMDWLIATPKGSAAWDGVTLRVDDAPCDHPHLVDEADELWRTYYAGIFNPARLKLKAMQAEMPKKYWKNLPEAALIPGLVAEAEQAVARMHRAAPTTPPAFHDSLQARAAPDPETVLMPGSLAALSREAASCTRCPLHATATQTVFGEGPEEADIMFVGEQPGDQEDLAGRPFVGPAGRIFDEALSQAGIDRASVYVTNAVKHFKYEPRGKRRIHQRPNLGEVRHCRWWIDREIALVRPKLIVAMGGTAVQSLTELREPLERLRGRPMPLEGGATLFVTVHPSYLLRIPDERLRHDEAARFQADIAAVRSLAGRLATVSRHHGSINTEAGRFSGS